MPPTDTRLEFDRATRRLLKIFTDGAVEIIHLTELEERLIEHMFEKNRLNGGAPALCPYVDLTNAAWPGRDYDDARRLLNGLVFGLRRKIEVTPTAPRFLTMHPGQGYALDVQPFTAVRPSSPFVTGPPIREPARFYGRTREVERIFGLWMHRPLHSAMVVGPQRSGKTSLLYYLRELPRAPPETLRPGQTPCPLPYSAVSGPDAFSIAYRIAFLSFQDPRSRSIDWVLGEILHGLGLRGVGSCPPETFAEQVASHLDSPSIVLLDEMDLGLRRPELRDLWGTLRASAIHHPRQLLAFVLACTHGSPVEPSSSWESPLLNIIGDRITLGPFTPTQAAEMIASSPRPFAAEDELWILEQSGRWPALLQIFCDTRLKSLERNDRTDNWKAEALERAHPLLRHLMLS